MGKSLLFAKRSAGLFGGLMIALQRISSKVRKGFVLGPASVGCRSQHLGVPDSYAGMRIVGYVSCKVQTVSGCVSALGSRKATRPD